VVTVKLQGACSTCSSSKVTLKSGVENMLMHYVPEVPSHKPCHAPVLCDQDVAIVRIYKLFLARYKSFVAPCILHAARI
jgi:hypothetical protein